MTDSAIPPQDSPTDAGDRLPVRRAAGLPERPPWEKLPKESYKAFAAFAVFRDLGPERTITKAAADLNRGVDQLREWSARHAWMARAEAYDLMVDQRMTAARLDEKENAARREAALGASLQMIAMRRLRGDEKLGIPALEAKDLTAQDVARLAETGVKIERQALGEPTEYVKGAFMVSPDQVRRIVSKLIETTLPYVPADQHAAWMRDLRADLADLH